MPITDSLIARPLVGALLLLLVLCAAPAQAEKFRVCTFSFNSPHEIDSIRANLPGDRFEIIDLSPPRLSEAGSAESVRPIAAAGGGAGSAGGAPIGPPAWLMNQCRPDVRCDIAVYSGEFGGRFFGTYGWSLGLQELEEASCNAKCGGLFQHPQEVFLLACNTLASKDQDSRTPREYLEVLIDHGFDRASAERIVDLRYGPLGPSFKESLRRIFMGVPQLYGFASVAPRGEWAAERLDRYFKTKGDYAKYLATAPRDSMPNKQILSAFRDTSFVQMAGVTPFEPQAADRGLVCRLYDETQTVTRRLQTIQQLFARQDFFSFLPTIEVFLRRHPAAQLQGEELRLFNAIQQQDQAREQVLRLVHDLNVSALKMEMAHLALNLQWMTRDEFRHIAVDGAKQLLAEPLTSEVVDIMCEIAKHEPIGTAFRSEDLPQSLFHFAEGYRLLDCLLPADKRVTGRLLAGLDSLDVSTRLWAGYALSRRLPLDDAVLRELVPHLEDESPDLRARLQWILQAQGKLPDDVREALVASQRDRAGGRPTGGSSTCDDACQLGLRTDHSADARQ